MSALSLTFEGKAVRTVGQFKTKDGTDAEMGWVLVDVCKATLHSNPSMVTKTVDPDEWGTLRITEGGPEQVMVDEPDSRVDFTAASQRAPSKLSTVKGHPSLESQGRFPSCRCAGRFPSKLSTVLKGVRIADTPADVQGSQPAGGESLLRQSVLGGATTSDMVSDAVVLSGATVL